MAENVLKTYGLSKQYGSYLAVNNVSMKIERGNIYGIVGRNGAGKTTLIRMITALTDPTAGEVELFGKKDSSGLKKTGSIVETPIMFLNMTAYDNLEYYRIAFGIRDTSISRNLLNLVGLGSTGAKKYKNFSLGMKQRLGIAFALLDNPEFLILDEPINGLDPIGIVEIRQLILDLNKQKGITFLISSHILSELAQIATNYGFIEKGVMLKEISNEGLVAECKKGISITVDDVEKAKSLLVAEMGVKVIEQTSNGELIIEGYEGDVAEISFQLNSNGVRVRHIEEKGENLENYFMNLIASDGGNISSGGKQSIGGNKNA